jgi:hypothetical protein
LRQFAINLFEHCIIEPTKITHHLNDCAISPATAIRERARPAPDSSRRSVAFSGDQGAKPRGPALDAAKQTTACRVACDPMILVEVSDIFSRVSYTRGD